MDYFLPDDVTYNREIPAPEQFFQQPLGEWHLTHDQVLNYIKRNRSNNTSPFRVDSAQGAESSKVVIVSFKKKMRDSSPAAASSRAADFAD